MFECLFICLFDLFVCLLINNVSNRRPERNVLHRGPLINELLPQGWNVNNNPRQNNNQQLGRVRNQFSGGGPNRFLGGAGRIPGQGVRFVNRGPQGESFNNEKKGFLGLGKIKLRL